MNLDKKYSQIEKCIQYDSYQIEISSKINTFTTNRILLSALIRDLGKSNDKI